jgi:exopolysaccharide production protein ExoQ
MHPSSAGKLEQIITVLVLVYFVDVFNAFGPVKDYCAIASYFILPFLFIRNWRRFLYFSTRDVLLVLFMGFTALSFFWSSSPSDTAINIRAVMRVTLFGIYFATRYTLKEQLRLLSWTFGIAILISFIVGPITQSGGVWRGGFNQKNVLARTMSISAMTYLTLVYSSLKHRWINLLGLCLSVCLLLLSQGKTALVIVLLVACLWPIRKVFKQYYLIRVPLVIVTLVVCTIAVTWASMNYETIIIDYLGKDLTLNGRTQLWDALVLKVQESPWIGFGLYAFWPSQRESLLGKVQYGWVPTNAHNGFLDLVLALGFIGLFLFLVDFFMAYSRAIYLAIKSRSIEGFWPLLFLTFFFFFNCNDVQIVLSPFDISWLLYTSTVITLIVPSRVSDIIYPKSPVNSRLNYLTAHFSGVKNEKNNCSNPM